MANIKKMQMWNTICADARFSVSKSFLGLSTTVTYQKTNSVLDARTYEYGPADGDKLRTILQAPHEGIAKAVGSFQPKSTVNGNYMAEVCTSRDGAFLAVQLLQFSHLSYEPVTDVLYFEGDEARTVSQLFQS